MEQSQSTPTPSLSTNGSVESKDDEALKRRQLDAWNRAEDTFYGRNGLTADRAGAVPLYEHAANLGYVPAMHECGLIYRGGVGVATSNERAVEWMTRAASLGFARSQYSMGIYSRDGIGTAVDLDKSAQYFKAAADQGHHDAANSWAVCLETGRGVTKDMKEAFRWYYQSAFGGDAVHQYNLAQCYSQGVGCSVDVGQAIHWFEKAAAQRHTGACWNLSSIYSRGKGEVVADSYRWAYWMKQAANCGSAEAPARLTCEHCTCRSMPIVMDVMVPPPSLTLEPLYDGIPSLNMDDEQRAVYHHGITIHELILWRRLALRFSDNTQRIFQGSRDDRAWCMVPLTYDGGISDDIPDEPLLTTLEGVWLGIIISEEMHRLRQLAAANKCRIQRPLAITINHIPLAILIHCWQSNVLPLPQPIFVQILAFLDEELLIAQGGKLPTVGVHIAHDIIDPNNPSSFIHSNSSSRRGSTTSIGGGMMNGKHNDTPTIYETDDLPVSTTTNGVEIKANGMAMATAATVGSFSISGDDSTGDDDARTIARLLLEVCCAHENVSEGHGNGSDSHRSVRSSNYGDYIDTPGGGTSGYQSDNVPSPGLINNIPSPIPGLPSPMVPLRTFVPSSRVPTSAHPTPPTSPPMPTKTLSLVTTHSSSSNNLAAPLSATYGGITSVPEHKRRLTNDSSLANSPMQPASPATIAAFTGSPWLAAMNQQESAAAAAAAAANVVNGHYHAAPGSGRGSGHYHQPIHINASHSHGGVNGYHGHTIMTFSNAMTVATSDVAITSLLNTSTFRQWPSYLTSLIAVLLVRPAGARYRSPLPWPGVSRALRSIITRGQCLECNHIHRSWHTHPTRKPAATEAATALAIAVASTSGGTPASPIECRQCHRMNVIGSCSSCALVICQYCEPGSEVTTDALPPASGVTKITCALCNQLQIMHEWMRVHTIDVATVSSL